MQKQRIEYLDAIRGFTMLLVVYGHVKLFSFHFLGGGSFNTFFVMISMPLFFFVSGFLLEKPNQQWKKQNIIPFLKKKVQYQLVRTFVFMLAFCYWNNLRFCECLISDSKFGYWFTISLFEYFLIYVFCKLLPDKIFCKLLFAISFILCAIKGMNLTMPFASSIQLSNAWYFSFFSFGVFIKRHSSCFTDFLESKKFSIVLFLFLVLCLLRIKGSFLNELPFQIIQVVICGILGICVIFNFFKTYANYFAKDKIIGRSLQYIGTRTLDVYLIHYLFLPHNLNIVGNFLKTYNNPTIEFMLSSWIAIFVVGICLVISNCIRTSPILAKVLLGVKIS